MPKKLGGKVQRFTVGGSTFHADRWYKLPPQSVQLLEPIPQSRFTATKMFQVVSEAEYVEITRRELANAMLGSAGADALAVLHGLQGAPALGKSAKSKTKPSDFAKLKVEEVDQTHGLRAAVTKDAADPDEDDDLDLDDEDEDDTGPTKPDADPKETAVVDPTKAGQPDIEGLRTKAQAAELAATYGLDFDSKEMTLTEMKKRLTAEIFGTED